MESHRIRKVEEAYKKEITQLLLFEARDPLLQSVRVTRVIFTPDLRLARIYYEADGPPARRKDVLKGLKRSRGFLKKELADRIKLRFMPELEFHYDETTQASLRVEELFRKLEEEKNKT
ncbi:MAG: 30S ribosome-binding factor RbfA [Deltaproteobacteria bacterium]|nr:30S ribosome-binding factor RbfA [Deltaproteobacteria bacterium]